MAINGALLSTHISTRLSCLCVGRKHRPRHSLLGSCSRSRHHGLALLLSTQFHLQEKPDVPEDSDLVKLQLRAYALGSFAEGGWGYDGQ